MVVSPGDGLGVRLKYLCDRVGGGRGEGAGAVVVVVGDATSAVLVIKTKSGPGLVPGCGLSRGVL